MLNRTTAVTANPSTPSQPGSEPWTTWRLLDQIRNLLSERGVDSPRVVAEMLLSHVLKCERMRLYMEVDRPASADELAALRALVKRAANHEPVQYLLGEWSFFGRTFAVNPSTLIPRPCTETLVEHAIQWARTHRPAQSMPIDRPASVIDGTQMQTEPMRVADIGTGTGCIAVCLAAHLPMAHVLASDVIDDALDLAKANAARHGVLGQIDLRAGDALAALEGAQPFDVICSNPPYISDAEWADVEANVRDYEPQSALRGGEDGLAMVRPIIEHAWQYLVPGGLLLVEIAESQRDTAIEIASAAGRYESVAVHKDHEGLWRVLHAQVASES